MIILYGVDKNRAMQGRSRVSEKMLITFAFAMGGAGSVVGMLLFWHKIRKYRFSSIIFLALILNIIIIFSVPGLFYEQDYFAH